MNKNLYLITLLLSFILACSAGKQALQRGDYLKSVEQAVGRLQSSPGNRKARETLARAYPQLTRYYEDQIAQAKRGIDPLRWENVSLYYGFLEQAYEMIQRSPAALTVIPNPRNYQMDLNASRVKAAEARYALGMQFLDKARAGDRQAAKQAYEHFQVAMEYQPNFRDSDQMMLEARDLATVYVLVEPIPMHSRSLNLTSEFFQNQIVEYVRNTTFSPFVHFYGLGELNATGQEPDQVVRMAFDDFVVGQATIRERVLKREVDSVVVGTVTVNEGGKEIEKDVYGSVSAEVHMFEKTLTSTGLLDVQIIDPRRRSTISQRKFPGTFEWRDRWGYFNGDERALTDEDRQTVRTRREVMPPPPQQLFIEFTKPIYNQVTTFLRNYYNRM
jgi:hypothetical protein